MTRALGEVENVSIDPVIGAPVFSLKQSSVAKLSLLGALVGAALFVAPSLAEAQARGTLQATAVVVNTAPAFEVLRGVQAATRQWVRNDGQQESTVATLASITITEGQRSANARAVVVTVDYSRN